MFFLIFLGQPDKDDLIIFFIFDFMGQLVNCLGEGAKYINFRAKSKFLMLLYIPGSFF